MLGCVDVWMCAVGPCDIARLGGSRDQETINLRLRGRRVERLVRGGDRARCAARNLKWCRHV